MMDKKDIISARQKQDQYWETLREAWEKWSVQDQGFVAECVLSGNLAPLITSLGAYQTVQIFQIFFEEIAVRGQERALAEKEMEES